MRKVLASTIAAVTFGGAVAATAAPAQAQSYYRHRDRDNNDAAAAAIIAGVAGLALGAALASKDKNRGYYNNRNYDPRYGSSRGYYNNGYGYAPGYAYAPQYGSAYGAGYGSGYGYRTCTRTERVWDPYRHRTVKVKRRFAC